MSNGEGFVQTKKPSVQDMLILENNTKPFMAVHVGSKTPPGSVTFIQIPKELITPTALKSYSIKAIEIWQYIQ